MNEKIDFTWQILNIRKFDFKTWTAWFNACLSSISDTLGSDRLPFRAWNVIKSLKLISSFIISLLNNIPSHEVSLHIFGHTKEHLMALLAFQSCYLTRCIQSRKLLVWYNNNEFNKSSYFHTSYLTILTKWDLILVTEQSTIFPSLSSKKFTIWSK